MCDCQLLTKYLKLTKQLFCVDICATTTTEGYTPLHLAARYSPHNVYESAVREDTESALGNYSSYTLQRQRSSEAAIKFLITKVDVSYSLTDQINHCTFCYCHSLHE